jgi:hypothetical protein
VLISGAGSPPASTVTDFPNGAYGLTVFGSGPYTVTPSKVGGQNGYITSFDAARIAQHVTAVSLFTTESQKVVADVSNNGGITSLDSGLIARYVAGLGAPIGITGSWRFFVPPGPSFPVGAYPTSRNYPTLTNDVSGDDYIGLLMGEVTGNWTNSGARPAGSGGPERSIAVKMPELGTRVDNEITVPINVEGLADKGIISYEFDLRYDPSVMQPLEDPIDVAGTISRGLTVVANAAEPGLLRVVVYGPTPIDGDGTLLNIRFRAVGNEGSESALAIERLMFNEGEIGTILSQGRVGLLAGVPY